MADGALAREIVIFCTLYTNYHVGNFMGDFGKLFLHILIFHKMNYFDCRLQHIIEVF